MSNEVNTLAASFVAMAQAFEKLPQVQAQLDQAHTMIEEYAKQVQSLELRMIDRKNENDILYATIQKVEAERDDAELRFLESEDRVTSALSFIKSTFGSAGSLIQALEPPAPVVVVVPIAEPEPEVKVGASEGSVSMDPQQGTTKQSSGNITQEQGTGNASSFDPGPAIGDAFTDAGQSATGEFASTNVGQTQHSEQRQILDGIVETVEPLCEGISVPLDPTASSTAGDGHSLETAQVTVPISTDASTQAAPATTAPLDDVGYHNEPNAGQWIEWNQWCNRMNDRYSIGQWPPRPAYVTAAQ